MENNKALTEVAKGTPEYRLTTCRKLCAKQESLFNPASIQRTFENVQTMDKCIELTKSGDLPTLLQMSHQEGNGEKIVALVKLNIIALDAYLHLNNRLTEQEIDTLSADIVQLYGGALSFADLNIVLTNARRGVYGKFYERLSAVDIMSWFDDYFNARLNECATRTRYEQESRPTRHKAQDVSKEDAAFAIYKSQYNAERAQKSAPDGAK